MIVPHAFAYGKHVVDSMIVSDHLDIISCVLGHFVYYVCFIYFGLIGL